MAAALISNKPEFVKLFLEQGVRLKEFVTWDTLVYLYDNLAPSCLFHSKLQKVLLEEREHTAGSKMPRLQMHHVSQVLRELLGCSTQPLYPKPKHTERPRLSIPVPHIKLNVRFSRLPGGRVAAGRGQRLREMSWGLQLGLCPLVCSVIPLKVPQSPAQVVCPAFQVQLPPSYSCSTVWIRDAGGQDPVGWVHSST